MHTLCLHTLKMMDSWTDYLNHHSWLMAINTGTYDTSSTHHHINYFFFPKPKCNFNLLPGVVTSFFSSFAAGVGAAAGFAFGFVSSALTGSFEIEPPPAAFAIPNKPANPSSSSSSLCLFARIRMATSPKSSSNSCVASTDPPG
jgi:hypothetical protein